jgi:hypothetical protein
MFELIPFVSFFVYNRALNSCVDGIIDWYKMHPVCPGYIEAFMQNQKNPAYAEHFKKITGLNWLECDSDEEDDDG